MRDLHLNVHWEDGLWDFRSIYTTFYTIPSHLCSSTGFFSGVKTWKEENICRSQWFVPLHLSESHGGDLYERTRTALERVGKLPWLLQMLNTAITLFSPLLEEGANAGLELLI